MKTWIVLLVLLVLVLSYLYYIHESHETMSYRPLHPIHRHVSPTPAPAPAPAPSEPPTHGKTFRDTMLSLHNKYRSLHGAQPLSWSAKLAQSAQTWANHQKARANCAMKHSGTPGVGENVAWQQCGGPGCDAQLHPSNVAAQSVNEWYAENKNYNYANPGFSSNTGHFTQLVWKGTREVGCAMVECGNGTSQAFTVCQYSPPGNEIGQFPQNVTSS